MKGLTLIETMVILIIVGIAATLLLTGINPLSSSRCVGGYLHSSGTYYQGPRQIFGSDGKAIPCKESK